MTNTAPVGEHVGVTEIGELLGVSRQRANKLVARPDFPAPVAQTRAGRVWEQVAVVTWEKGWDRNNVGGRPPKSTAPQQE